jgi:hypothetical protein
MTDIGEKRQKRKRKNLQIILLIADLFILCIDLT